MENKKPRLFHLVRLKDGKGISGTGKVIDGVMFPDGKVVIQWQGRYTSISVFNNMEDFIAVHAKPFFGDNEFHWVEGYEPTDELDSALDEIADYVMRQKVGLKDKTKGNIVGKILGYKRRQAQLKDPTVRKAEIDKLGSGA